MAAANAGRSGTTGCDHRNPASRTAIEPVPPGCWEKRKESILMRVFGASAIGATAVIALLAGPVHAQQMPNINLIPELGSKSPEEKEQDAVKDEADREALKKSQECKASNDAGGTVHVVEAAIDA